MKKELNIINETFSFQGFNHFRGANGIRAAISPTTTSLRAMCNKNCQCSLSRFAPVCGSDNVTYFDMCYAGCKARLPDMVTHEYNISLPEI